MTASFVKQTRDVDVDLLGGGGGTVSFSPAAADCTTDCGRTFEVGTTVTLSAVPDAGSTFLGWSGQGCAGTDPCTVTLSQAAGAPATVSATFATQTRELAVDLQGPGAGTVTFAPAALACSADCTRPFELGQVVTLAAQAAAGSAFAGWSGEGCSGTQTCVVTLSQARSVAATFELVPVTAPTPTPTTPSPPPPDRVRPRRRHRQVEQLLPPVATAARFATFVRRTLRVRRGRVALTLRCPAGRTCEGIASLLGKRGKRDVRLGSVRFRMIAGTSRAVRVTLSRSGKRFLRGRRSRAVIVQISPRPSGRVARSKATLRLR